MCPGAPYEVQRTCERPENATKTIAQHLGKRGMLRDGVARDGILRSVNVTRERRRAIRDQDLGARPSRTTKEKLVELASLRDEHLITLSEYDTLRARILDGLAGAAVVGKRSQ